MDKKRKSDIRNLTIVLIILFSLQLGAIIAVYKYLHRPKTVYLSDVKLHIMLEKNSEKSICIVYISKDGTFGNDYIKYQYPCRDYNYIHFITPDSLYAINQDGIIKEIKSNTIKILKIDYEYNSNNEHTHLNDSNYRYKSYLIEMEDSVFIKKPHYVLSIDNYFRDINLFFFENGYYYDSKRLY